MLKSELKIKINPKNMISKGSLDNLQEIQVKGPLQIPVISAGHSCSSDRFVGLNSFLIYPHPVFVESVYI